MVSKCYSGLYAILFIEEVRDEESPQDRLKTTELEDIAVNYSEVNP